VGSSPVAPVRHRARACATHGRVRAGSKPRRFVERVGLKDPALGLDDLAEGPEGDPFAVRQAAALAPPDQPRPLIDVVEKLGAETALADPRLADQRDQLARDRPLGAPACPISYRL
jgi:hypothetical protein